MKLYTSKHVWSCMNCSNSLLCNTLNWICGYIDNENKNLKLINYFHFDDLSVEVNIDNDVLQEIKEKFGKVNSEIITSLAILALILGGQE